jgi:hypothetical protein
MEGFAAQPGMQLSSDNPAQRRAPAEPYGNRYYMGFETRHCPDWPNRPEFPFTVVTPSTQHEVTV